MSIKKILKVFLITVCVILSLLAVSLLIISVIINVIKFRIKESFWETYETNSISDYGCIVGNNDNDTPSEFIFSFFPQEIDESFSNVTYHYKAMKGDAYAYEAYLEFTISDTEKYQDFVNALVNREECQVFAYDGSFYNYTISDKYVIDTNGYLNEATFGKILFSDEKQSFVFTAIGMYDGGARHAMDLGYFLQRFGISPQDIATYVIQREGTQGTRTQ